MSDLVAQHPDLEGVFAANDLMAQGARQALRERGRRVPEDVAVVGFDDSTVAVTCRPRLTTVRQPVEDMAAEMARLLDEHIHGTHTEATSVVFDPELWCASPREPGLAPSGGLTGNPSVETDLVRTGRWCGARAPEPDLGQTGPSQLETVEEPLDLAARAQVQRGGGLGVDGPRRAAVGEVAGVV